ncbi:hypothetical protein CMALT394_450030 [Carnobacterium maltaromaticum]|nr:hypothetical protein CMALT394_450030 [Carnobacterium maltaromaticum]
MFLNVVQRSAFIFLYLFLLKSTKGVPKTCLTKEESYYEQSKSRWREEEIYF